MSFDPGYSHFEKLSFERVYNEDRATHYDFVIDGMLEQEKAVKIADILADEKIIPDIGSAKAHRIAIKATGTIRAMAMRLIINLLAE